MTQQTRAHYEKRDSRPAERYEARDPLARVRRYNNYCKAVLLREATEQPRVLDLGCGRGGDIQKYNTIRAVRVDGVDVSMASLYEARRRTPARLNAHFHQADLTDPVSVSELPRGPYDCVSMLFSIQHLVPTRDHAVRLMHELAARTVAGGVCLIALPDSDMLNHAADAGVTALAQVSHLGAIGWGSTYTFRLSGAIHDCLEFVVPHADLVDVAREAGWETVKDVPFSAFCEVAPGLAKRMGTDPKSLRAPELATVAIYRALVLVHRPALDAEQDGDHDRQHARDRK